MSHQRVICSAIDRFTYAYAALADATIIPEAPTCFRSYGTGITMGKLNGQNAANSVRAHVRWCN